MAALLSAMVSGTGIAQADSRKDCLEAPDMEVTIAGCTAVIAREPNAGWAYNNRAYAYERLDRGKESLADANKAVALLPKDAMAWAVRASAYVRLKDYSRALSDATKAIQLNGNLYEGFINRAYIYEKLGERDRAIADYRRAQEIRPSNPYPKAALERLGAKP